MVNKLWCQKVAKNLFQQKGEPPHARVFSEAKWNQSVSTSYLVYRSLIFLFWATCVICSFFELGSAKPNPVYEKWPIFVTNWDLVFGLSQSICGLILVVRRWKLQKIPGFDPSTLKLGFLERAYWFLYVLTSSLATAITITYWTLVFDPTIHIFDVLNTLVHVCNCVVMLLDFCVTNIPFLLRCVWWNWTVMLSFSIFSVIYTVAGGTDKDGCHYIYKILDWSKPGASLLYCGFELLLLTVVHLVLCYLSTWKDRIYAKITMMLGRSSSDPDSNNKPKVEKSLDLV